MNKQMFRILKIQLDKKKIMKRININNNNKTLIYLIILLIIILITT